MKKIVLILVLAFLMITNANAQSKDCHPDCNITWEEIRNSRNPLWTMVDITPECANKIKIRREEFEAEDSQNFQYLRNVACSHAKGWVENIEGECQAGGPPPCCQVQHWHNDANAWQKWKQIQRVVYEKRWNELTEIYKSCMKEEKAKNDEKIKEELIKKKQKEADAKRIAEDQQNAEIARKQENANRQNAEQEKRNQQQEDATRRQQQAAAQQQLENQQKQEQTEQGCRHYNNNMMQNKKQMQI